MTQPYKDQAEMEAARAYADLNEHIARLKASLLAAWAERDELGRAYDMLFAEITQHWDARDLEDEILPEALVESMREDAAEWGRCEAAKKAALAILTEYPDGHKSQCHSLRMFENRRLPDSARECTCGRNAKRKEVGV